MCKEKHEKANVESPFYWFFENVIMDQEDRVSVILFDFISLIMEEEKLSAKFLCP